MALRRHGCDCPGAGLHVESGYDRFVLQPLRSCLGAPHGDNNVGGFHIGQEVAAGKILTSYRCGTAVMCERFGVSQRRACRVVGQHCSTQRTPELVIDPEEERLRAWLRTFAKNHPRWGWRRATDHARAEWSMVNRKRVQRLWRRKAFASHAEAVNNGFVAPAVSVKCVRSGPTRCKQPISNSTKLLTGDL
jgi:HTH-like domain